MDDLKEVEFRLATHQVNVIRWLTDKVFVVRMDRNNLKFKPGQHIKVGIKGDDVKRYYSIYSSDNDPFLEMLVLEVENGKLTRKLKQMSQSDELEVIGPRGSFHIKEEELNNSKYLFVATGTGIAPYRSFIKSYPELNYTILHGTKYSFEAYDRIEYDSDRFILCTSRDVAGDYHGRVTSYLQQMNIDDNVIVYLCGNNSMIKDSIEILHQKGITPDRIRTEIYY